jgi:riboflavin biosynthesis pyrimidine reductase
VRSLLCEGGPTLYGAFVAAGLVDDEFLTLSPLLIGNPTMAAARPGLIEGVGFVPDAAPRVRLLSVRKAGEFLFLRSTYR